MTLPPHHLLPLLESTPVPDSEGMAPGGIAIVVILGMALATFLLWLNMNKQLKKVNFVEGGQPRADDTDGADGADQAESAEAVSPDSPDSSEAPPAPTAGEEPPAG